MAGLKLTSHSHARANHGHPWVFANEVQKLLAPEYDGQAVGCRDGKGFLLGTGIYNGRSQIVWRRFSREKEELDENFLRKTITRSVNRRKPETSRRLVWSEADDLPGLIVDQYGDIVVMQALTLAMDRLTPILVSILKELLRPRFFILRNDAPIRLLEGLPLEVNTLGEERPTGRWCQIGEIDFWLDVVQGHKTGCYLDQREQYLHVARYAKGRRVLDAFCNQGGFALHCAQAGAKEVVGVDLSEPAITLARENARNSGGGACFETENVFDWFRHRREEWDMIILDPPSFTKTKAKLDDALRGYRELNLRAIQRLTPGGILATYTCSYHISHDIFLEMLVSAAGDAKRDIRILEICRQPLDHPIRLNMPESEYLRGFILEVE